MSETGYSSVFELCIKNIFSTAGIGVRTLYYNEDCAKMEEQNSQCSSSVDWSFSLCESYLEETTAIDTLLQWSRKCSLRIKLFYGFLECCKEFSNIPGKERRNPGGREGGRIPAEYLLSNCIQFKHSRDLIGRDNPAGAESKWLAYGAIFDF
jgi:hypothetical protein